jgi:hypothetical protein
MWEAEAGGSYFNPSPARAKKYKTLSIKKTKLN